MRLWGQKAQKSIEQTSRLESQARVDVVGWTLKSVQWANRLEIEAGSRRHSLFSEKLRFFALKAFN